MSDKSRKHIEEQENEIREAIARIFELHEALAQSVQFSKQFDKLLNALKQWLEHPLPRPTPVGGSPMPHYINPPAEWNWKTVESALPAVHNQDNKAMLVTVDIMFFRVACARLCKLFQQEDAA